MEEISFDNIEGKIIDDFKILELIGKGASSRVHLAMHLPTKNYVAAKIIDLHVLSESEFQGITREISVFMQVSHPNIAKLFRLSQVGNFLIFFMELALGGTLCKYVINKKGLTEAETYKIFTQLFTVFYYLEYKHFLAHRDIKLENILLDQHENVKVIDFGLSDVFYGSPLKHCVGTPGFQAPEVMMGSDYNEKCDTWSLGITLYAMLAGQIPFSSHIRDGRRLMEEASNNKPKLTGISAELQDLLCKMLEPVAMRRPSIGQLVNHPWFRGAIQPLKNVGPRPVIFYKVPSYSDVLKFKRKPEGIVNDLLDKCERYGISREKLKSQLENGEITNETTTYYVLSLSCTERPEQLSVRLPPLSRRRFSKDNKSPKGNGAIISARQMPYKKSLGKKKIYSFIHPLI